MSIVRQQQYPYLEQDLAEECLADASVYLYQQLTRRTYQHTHGDPDHFTNHFYTIIKRQLYKTVMEVQQFTYLPAGSEPDKSPKPIHPWDVEQHIYLEQLPGQVRDLVMRKIRFEGQEYQACLYVLDRVLTGARIVPAYMKNELNVRDPNFLVTYMVVVLRSTLYDLKLQNRSCFGNVFGDRFLHQ